jgi:hypothetical protein
MIRIAISYEWKENYKIILQRSFTIKMDRRRGGHVDQFIGGLPRVAVRLQLGR